MLRTFLALVSLFILCVIASNLVPEPQIALAQSNVELSCPAGSRAFDPLNTVDQNTQKIRQIWCIDSLGRVIIQQDFLARIAQVGSSPTCSFTSGGGTGPGCILQQGSTDSIGTIFAQTGTGAPAGTGTITLTWSSAPFGINVPSCVFIANDGSAAWQPLAVMKDLTQSGISDVFTWTNGTTPTALSTSSTYRINYVCGGK